METHAPIQAYRRLELKMVAVREKHRGADSEEEDAILEELDDSWWTLTYEERTYLNTHRPNHEALVKWLPAPGGV